MESKRAILIALTIIEIICLFFLKNEPYIIILMIITLILWAITAIQISRRKA